MLHGAAHIVALTLHTGTYDASMASGDQIARVVQPRRLILVPLAADAPCIGVLCDARLPWLLMAVLTAMCFSAGAAAPLEAI